MSPSRSAPAIACIGLLGRHNEPLHVSTFFVSPTKPERTTLDYHKHLFSSIDIFSTRGPDTPDGNYNLLFALDTRLAFFGWLSPTGIKYVIGVDMEGKAAPEQAALEGGSARSALQTPNGIRYGDLAPAFAALRRAYARLLRDPFYDGGEEEDSFAVNGGINGYRQDGKVKNRGFINEVTRIGESWYTGIAVL